MDTLLIMRAASFAAAAHGAQTRKELKEAYINHPIAVAADAAELGCSAEFIAACLLHDVVEDTDVTLAELDVAFADHPYTVTLVEAVSKWWDKRATPAEVAENKRKYYQKICDTAGGPLLKVLDRRRNLMDMIRTIHNSPSANKWARTYLAKTLEEFPPVLSALLAQGLATPGPTTNPELNVRMMFNETLAQLAQEIAK